MKLIDSSAWIDFLRADDTRARDEVRRLLAAGANIAITEPITMELLAGATDPRALARLETLTNGLPVLGIEPRLDYHDAAVIYRLVRSSGRTVRRLNDCLIAAVAIRHDATLVHKDADFETIAATVRLDAQSLR